MSSGNEETRASAREQDEMSSCESSPISPYAFTDRTCSLASSFATGDGKAVLNIGVLDDVEEETSSRLLTDA